MNRQIAKKINEMAREDQMARKLPSPSTARIDRKNTVELKKIISKYGWPTISSVGKRASFNAWLLAQHADHDRKFQKGVLKLLISIDKNRSGDINRANIAYLTDRLLVAGKRKQVFGTQFSYFGRERKLRLYPLRNKRGVDKLRAKYNLPSLKSYIKSAGGYSTRRRLKKMGTN